MNPSFPQALAAFARIGLLSFGGPAGQIATMHRVLVDEKRWLDEPRFLHALNFCMLLPGPEAQQLATYAGWLLHGVKGGLAAGILFVLPGFLVMLGLAALYAGFSDLTYVQGLFLGIKPAVLAVVVGFYVISGVSHSLHTPLIAQTNAISGITIVGAIIAAGADDGSWITTVLGTAAVTLAMINVIGGYFVTDRMLAMFKPKAAPSAAAKKGDHAS